MERNFQFEFKQCDISYLDDILRIQEEAFEVIDNPDLLRRNTKEMLSACLAEPHYTLGAYVDGKLAGFAVLFDGERTKENLGYDIGIDDSEVLSVVNLKLIIVSPAYRGNGLQRKMTALLEDIAKQRGKKYICVTVSPDNEFSRKNVECMNYIFHSQKEKYNGMLRNLYYKKIDD